MKPLLLLEDDLLLGESIEDLLEEEGYAVTWCRNGQEALDASFETQFSLYLFDINVPLIDGLTLLSELRAANDKTPAIYLTSHQDKSILQKGFEIGADDYLKKPFDNDELLLRIKALLRRTEGHSKECTSGLCVERERMVVSEGGRVLRLSKKEYTLLTLFIENANKVVSKEMIIEALWSQSEQSSDGSIRVLVTRLKQELQSVSIENIRGIGYRLVS